MISTDEGTRSLLGGARESARKQEALSACLGPVIRSALIDPDVVEVCVNPDGRIWLDTHASGRRVAGQLDPHAAENLVCLLADRVGVRADRNHPRASGVLESGERFHALLPPIVEAPTFSLRKRSTQVFTLDDYVSAGTMRENQAAELRDAVNTRKNIVVVGGTGSGKTTLCNALLAEKGFHGDRVILIEDTAELQCLVPDSVSMRVAENAGATLRDLLRDTMRMRPDRIVIGEVRGGEALDLVKAWNTGHPGGLGTLHADGAVAGLRRLEELISEVAVNVNRVAIGEAVDVLVSIRRGADGRRVEEIVHVDGYDPQTGSYRTR
ncbi:P-type conjugative transfer ATPase TrbB [Phycisphaera mikurensis]|uniref:Conjugal transfer protein TrbB n=1 Tax=Phycisphaera mikurensis (strain NBRC 102666 / KCTC 22515 / FYK2301M01) TaxID=1142394 RepID=I0IJJ3_PHYMF|nr:P-type conjugative transfer ATPase TrbB [Phycisphaera mikurensis]MBB6443181.1 type IV secretion system protein VirB11 [Phycisphaera mikurensis]BAM05431.1 conjugal transfer protein TrbB [Phycisphaera mikurensis NBRC 102666]